MQQTVGERHGVIQRRAHRLQTFAPLLRPIAGQRHPDLGLQHRQRGAQLVRGVGAEAFLTRHHQPQPFDVTIKGHQQRLHLRPGKNPRQRRQFARIAPQHDAGEFTHRLQHPLEQRERQDQGQHHHRTLAQQRRDHHLPRQVTTRFQGFRHQNGRHAAHARLVDRLKQRRHADRPAEVFRIVEMHQCRIEGGAWNVGRQRRQIVIARDAFPLRRDHLVIELIVHVALEAVEHHIRHIDRQLAFAHHQPLRHGARRRQQRAIVGQGGGAHGAEVVGVDRDAAQRQQRQAKKQQQLIK
ncbi:Uncharacterised protein [Acinetobacter baumannii]|nr:Uncharacterised protein [Acinetobacter baumannii]